MASHFHGNDSEVRALGVYIKLLRATDTVAARLARSLAPHHLTMGQLGVLEALLHLGPLSQRDLGRKLLRSGANVTTVVDNLERDGLVKRERGIADRRLMTVSLTLTGRALISRVFPGHARLIVELLGHLTAFEQDELGRLLKKLGTGAAGATKGVAAAR
jgi:MarR family 2-MHQ and catechol resistance regulon transcriptional repressor